MSIEASGGILKYFCFFSFYLKVDNAISSSKFINWHSYLKNYQGDEPSL